MSSDAFLYWPKVRLGRGRSPRARGWPASAELCYWRVPQLGLGRSMSNLLSLGLSCWTGSPPPPTSDGAFRIFGPQGAETAIMTACPVADASTKACRHCVYVRVVAVVLKVLLSQ